jgi:hypothetical protein
MLSSVQLHDGKAAVVKSMEKRGLGMVATWEAWVQAGQAKNETLSEKVTKAKRAGRVAQVVELLPYLEEAQGPEFKHHTSELKKNQEKLEAEAATIVSVSDDEILKQDRVNTGHRWAGILLAPNITECVTLFSFHLL